MKQPRVPKELVDYLDKIYPYELPHPQDEWGAVLYRSGKRSVVDYLKKLAAQQEEKDVLS